MASTRDVRAVVCRAGPRRFALPVTVVREVCIEVPVVRMPGVASAIAGVATVRGSIITVVAAAELLGGESGGRPTEPGGGGADSKAIGPGWLVVLTDRRGRVALAVDEVEDVGPLPAATTVPMLDIETLIRPLFP